MFSEGRFTEFYKDLFRTFFFGVTQSASGISLPQAEHLTYIVSHCLASNIKTVETTTAAEADWQKVMAELNEIQSPFQQACTFGYLNTEGN